MKKKQKSSGYYNIDLTTIFSIEQIEILKEMAEIKGQTLDEFCNTALKKLIDNKKVEVDMNKMAKLHLGKEDK
jgi:hypothetical protein